MLSSEVLLREDKGRRSAPRSTTAFDTNLRSQTAARSPCRIIDISSGGARLMLYQQLDPETSIQIVLPGKGPVAAHIVWANGREAGCRFDRPLDEATVALLLSAANAPSPGA